MSTHTSASELSQATATSPSGIPLDPSQIKGRIFTSKYNVILGTSYLLSDKIFNFQIPTDQSTSPLSLWASLKRTNAESNVPSIVDLDITSDAGNLILGYLKNSSNTTTVFATADALTNIAPALLQHPNEYHSLPLSFQVSTLSYDFNAKKLSNTYTDALQIAKTLNIPVLTSTNAKEAQYFTVVSQVLAKLNIANIHLFNGKSVSVNETLNVSNADDLKKTFTELYNVLKGSIIGVPKTTVVSLALEKLNTILGTKFGVFEYFGNKDASSIYAVFAIDETVVEFARSTDDNVHDFGILLIKSAVPFESAKFNEFVGTNAKNINVVAETTNGVSSLRLDIQASLFFQGRFNVQVSDVSVTDLTNKFNKKGKSYRFLLNDNSKFIEFPAKLANAISFDEDIQFTPVYDNSINAGLFDVTISTGPYEKVDFLLVEDINILNSVNVFEFLNAGASLVILCDGFDTEKIEKKLSTQIKKLLASKEIELQLLDLEAIGEHDETKGRTSSIAIQSVFWTLTHPSLIKHSVVTKILQFFGSEAELLASVIADQVENAKAIGLKTLKYNAEWSTLEDNEDDEFSVIGATSFAPNPREAFMDNVNVQIEKPHELVKKLMFKEAYGTTKSLRPDQPVKNFVVKVKENKRLTPSDYDRNIFHIEFDVSGTGLTYNIGEALGVHGRNNAELVGEFIKMYGLDANELVEVAHKDNSDLFEIRTIEQTLIENLDLFGKPPKRFYESLIEFASDEDEKKELEKLISPAGAALFKKFQEEEFYTFADIFEIFKSVRPSAQDLVQLISPLKRREYSIASSQKLHPNEVHLLIVVVDWVDNKGRKRYGQCSKYLSDLQVGQELVVSVKPSIMKLPPLTTQPIIMAGLGTGLAPFKAFIEERQYQLEHGAEIGEIYLYLGSRHKRQEYLYGEYWESYMDANVLTHLGAAFSRDQPKKIYIQDKIRENLDELRDLIIDKQGHFYLCGPTWPVPDISACLQDVVKADAAKKGIKVDAAKAVEEMKEEGKYVLEVY
ncbi:unnamed protein product [Pichia kudriavzevii]